jgi:hypothetical protein
MRMADRRFHHCFGFDRASAAFPPVSIGNTPQSHNLRVNNDNLPQH